MASSTVRRVRTCSRSTNATAFNVSHQRGLYRIALERDHVLRPEISQRPNVADRLLLAVGVGDADAGRYDFDHDDLRTGCFPRTRERAKDLTEVSRGAGGVPSLET